jgi:hypothetical protein
MLGAVSEEACRALERLAADGQPDLRRLLHVAHPLAVHVRGSEIDLVAVHDEPDRDLVGLPGLAAVVRQSQGVPSRYSLQSRQWVRFHKLS